MRPWWDEVAGNARAHGALPYVVEGFTEITDAVRRGHAVLVRREEAEVAEGVTVFDAGATPDDGRVLARLRPDPGSAADRRDPALRRGHRTLRAAGRRQPRQVRCS